MASSMIETASRRSPTTSRGAAGARARSPRARLACAGWIAILAATLAGCGTGAIHGADTDGGRPATDAVAGDALRGDTGQPGTDAAGGGGGPAADGGPADGTAPGSDGGPADGPRPSADGGTGDAAAGGSDAGGGGGTAPCSGGGAGPRVTGLTASGPIVATSGATYAGLAITNPGGPCLTVNGASNVRLVDSELGPCGGEAAVVVNGADGVTIEFVSIHDSPRGVLAQHSSGVVTRRSRFSGINGTFPRGTAIEYDYMASGVMDGNCAEGSYNSDVLSGFESSGLQIIGNEVQATITEWSAAGFTIGDSVAGTPGHDNYVAGNRVYTSGGVPPGVFGSSGNTVLEHNCLTTGIQAYAYNGPFVGVVVRYNLIGPGSFVPDTSVIAEWDTNTFTDGSSCDGM
jgi:hypothetical protein